MGVGGRRDPSEYTYIEAEVFFDAVRRKKRVRALPGQAFSPHMYIECSNKIKELPIGTKVRIKVVETDKEGSEKFLYNSYKWPFEVLS